MALTVKLDDIIEAMEFQSDEIQSYLNKKTGQVVTISYEEFSAAEQNRSIEDFPDWQQEQIRVAEDILYSEDYMPLPDKFEINEYRIMEKFCLSLNDDEIRNDMYYSIKGRGAFRRFKENIHRYDIAEDWYKFRDEMIREIAIEWCLYNNISFIDEKESREH